MGYSCSADCQDSRCTGGARTLLQHFYSTLCYLLTPSGIDCSLADAFPVSILPVHNKEAWTEDDANPQQRSVSQQGDARISDAELCKQGGGSHVQIGSPYSPAVDTVGVITIIDLTFQLALRILGRARPCRWRPWTRRCRCPGRR